MAFCKKCGAYIPIDETACPACGYDPEEEARKAAEAEAAAKRAEEEARRKKQEAENWAAQERRREEEARRRAEQRARQQQSSQSSGAYQSQYTYQRTGQSGAAQGQYASERTGNTWTPPWSQSGRQTARESASRQTEYDDDAMRTKARESVENQRLSVLSYIWPLAVIPLVMRNKDDFARYHSNQGLVLLMAMGLGSVAASVIGSGALGGIVELYGLFCTVKGISNVLRGKKEPLPFIGGIKLLK